jgi:hypothetical protein
MSITSEQEYLAQLHQIQNLNPPSVALLPKAEQVYDIDLVTRTIKAPEFLSVAHDHKSETIYFRVDRYFDYMDLANTICLVEYVLPNDKDRVPHIYIVPFYDTMKFIKEGKLLFPWAVGGAATSQNGTLEYAVRFFKVSDVDGKLELVYNLNTLPAKSKVEKSLEVSNEIMNAAYDIPVERYEALIYQLENSKTTWRFLD